MNSRQLINLFIEKKNDLNIDRYSEGEFWMVAYDGAIHGFVINPNDVKHTIDRFGLDDVIEYITYEEAALELMDFSM